MKVNFNKQMKDLSGAEISEPGNTKDSRIPVTLASVCSTALVSNEKKEMEWKEKLDRYELAAKIKQSKGAIEVSVEQLSLIKESLAVMPILYCGQAIQMIESAK